MADNAWRLAVSGARYPTTENRGDYITANMWLDMLDGRLRPYQWPERAAPTDHLRQLILAKRPDAGAALDAYVTGDMSPVVSTALLRPPPRSLAELLASPELFEPPAPLIASLGMHCGYAVLLSAREKTGKSTLVGQAVAAASAGRDFLNETLVPFPTLWYALDEPLRDAVRRFAEMGADLDSVFLQDRVPTPLELADEVARTGAQLVVVDTVSRMWRGKIDSANDGEQVQAFLWNYIEAAREQDFGLVLLHHTNKAGREYRGSVEFGALVDLPITLRRRSGGTNDADEFDAEYDSAGAEDDGRRLLVGVGRAGVRVNQRLAFDGRTYSLGDAPLPLNTRVLRALTREGASADAVADILRTRRQTIGDTLHRLREAGLVVKVGKTNRSRWELTDAGMAEAAAVLPRADAVVSSGNESRNEHARVTATSGRNGNESLAKLEGIGNESGMNTASADGASAAFIPARYSGGHTDGKESLDGDRRTLLEGDFRCATGCGKPVGRRGETCITCALRHKAVTEQQPEPAPNTRRGG